MGRKKKLKKGIRSLDKQNGIHKEKIEEEKRKQHPNEERIAYWGEERIAYWGEERRKFRRDIDRKKKKIERKKGK